MKITIKKLKALISEEIQRTREGLWGTRDELSSLVDDMADEEVTMDDLIDSETGEYYLQAGQTPDKARIGRRAAQKKTPAVENDPYDSLQGMIEKYVQNYDIDDLASMGDVESLVSDAADSFFSSPESSGWEDVADDMGLSREEVKAWVASELYSMSSEGRA